jgi:hypothetical protein
MITHRTVELESAVIGLQNQMLQKDEQICAILLAAEERSKILSTLQRRLEEYERERWAMNTVIEQSMDTIRRVEALQ